MGLPDKPFLINYNARDYDTQTRTLPNAEGGLFDDAVLNADPVLHLEDGYISVNGQYFQKRYSSTSDNPFNRDGSHNGFTAVYKVLFHGASDNLFANRGNSYNYMIRHDVFHTSDSGFLRLISSEQPYIEYVRIQSDGHAERVNVTTQQSVSATSTSWGGASNGVGLFVGFGTQSSEQMNGDFYWLYLTNEVLTDDEIQKVINFNEHTFSPSEDSFNFPSTGGTAALEITSQNPWTATTEADWIELSAYSGEGDTELTITVGDYAYEFADREGVITFSDGEDAFDITVFQKRKGIVIPQKRIIRGNLRIN